MIPASGPGRASALVRSLWRELSKPADELDLARIVEAVDVAVAALAPVVDRFEVAFAAKSRRRRPLLPGVCVPCWHGLPAAVVGAAFAHQFERVPRPPSLFPWRPCSVAQAADGAALAHRIATAHGWRERIVEVVHRFPRALKELDAELAAVTRKPRGSVAAALAYLVDNPTATDVEAAKAAGVTTRALRGSKNWKMARDGQHEMARCEVKERFENAEELARSSGLRVRKNRRK